MLNFDRWKPRQTSTPTRVKDSPTRVKDSPTGVKDSPTRVKDSPTRGKHSRQPTTTFRPPVPGGAFANVRCTTADAHCTTVGMRCTTASHELHHGHPCVAPRSPMRCTTATTRCTTVAVHCTTANHSVLTSTGPSGPGPLAAALAQRSPANVSALVGNYCADHLDDAACVGMGSSVARVYLRRRASQRSASSDRRRVLKGSARVPTSATGQQKPASRGRSPWFESAGEPCLSTRDIAPHASPLSPTNMNRNAARLIMYD